MTTWGKLQITGKGNIKIGRDVTLICDSKYNPIAGPGIMHFTIMNNALLTIGDGTKITCCTITVRKQVVIGNNVLIGANCMICDTDFHALSPHLRLKDDYNNAKIKPVQIGNDVFIGARSIILKGTSIGDGAVIGAGSVVSGNIPSMEIWAGNPARFIKKVEYNN